MNRGHTIVVTRPAQSLLDQRFMHFLHPALLGAAASLGIVLTIPTANATPIPRLWLKDIEATAWEENCRVVGILRSQPSISPDGRWELYSRLTYEVTPVGYQQLTSVLFARDRQSGTVIAPYTPASPFSPLLNPDPTVQTQQDFVLLLPLEWQEESFLVQEYAGMFRSDAIAQQAVVWSSGESLEDGTLEFVTPTPPLPVSLLLGWDGDRPDHILFAVSDFIEPPQIASVGGVHSIGERETQLLPEQSAPDWSELFASVNLESAVDDAAAAEEANSWFPANPTITGGPQCLPITPL